MEEQWLPIEEFPNYLISNYGKVYSLRTEKMLSESKTTQGDYKVTLSEDGVRVTRSVRVLVAEAFIPRPMVPESYHASAIPNTVIMLDNDKNNIHPRNLAWRPAWFAQKYARQFKPVYPPEYYSKAIMNIDTGVVYSSILEAGIKEGLLFEDLQRSARTETPIYLGYSVYKFT